MYVYANGKITEITNDATYDAEGDASADNLKKQYTFRRGIKYTLISAEIAYRRSRKSRGCVSDFFCRLERVVFIELISIRRRLLRRVRAVVDFGIEQSIFSRVKRQKRKSILLFEIIRFANL